jgi:hypothetical protein
MRQKLSASQRSGHAITDLYDETRGVFLIQYPVWLVITLALAGVAAFAMAGFLGYTHLVGGTSQPLTAGDRAFIQPWELFLWFSALMLTLLISIFRDKSLRGRLIAMLITACLAIILVGIFYFSNSLPDFLQQLLKDINLAALASDANTYTFINFLIIAIFWADTIRRWVRRMRGLPPSPRVDIGWGSVRSSYDPNDMPSLQELISGDLIAGAVLTFALAGLFEAGFLSLFIHTTPPMTTCTVSWPFGACAGGGGVHNPPTLTFMDLIQTLVYLPLGLIILALAATLSGLGAVGGVNDKTLEAQLPAAASAEQSSTPAIAVDVSTTVLNTLKSALNRRLRLIVNNLILSLRMVGWPALIFIGTYGLAELSTNIQNYLHSGKHVVDFLSYVLPAAGWGLATILCLVFSAALLLFRWRVADNTLRFIGLIGFVILLTFWIFSLALWGFNQLLLKTGASQRHPFDPPSFTTYISLAALLIFGILWSLRLLRGPRAQPGSATPAPTVGANPPASAGFSVATPPAGSSANDESATRPVSGDPNATNATNLAQSPAQPPDSTQR